MTKIFKARGVMEEYPSCSKTLSIYSKDGLEEKLDSKHTKPTENQTELIVAADPKTIAAQLKQNKRIYLFKFHPQENNFELDLGIDTSEKGQEPSIEKYVVTELESQNSLSFQPIQELLSRRPDLYGSIEEIANTYGLSEEEAQEKKSALKETGYKINNTPILESTHPFWNLVADALLKEAKQSGEDITQLIGNINFAERYFNINGQKETFGDNFYIKAEQGDNYWEVERTPEHVYFVAGTKGQEKERELKLGQGMLEVTQDLTEKDCKIFEELALFDLPSYKIIKNYQNRRTISNLFERHSG